MKRVLLLALACLSCGASVPLSLADDITLDLFPPTYCACGWISVNGYVSSDRTVWGLVWDWGDGTKSLSWFPANHRYAQNGTYQVVATAVGCTTQSDTVTVEVTNSEDPGCPTDDAPPCHASQPCLYLRPVNMHLVDDATSDLPLTVVDGDGTPASGTIEYDVGDPTLVSIAPDAYVTALRVEGSSETGTWIGATLDGHGVANASIVRVLPQDYGVPFSERKTNRTVLFHPAAIGGEDLGGLVELYEIPAVNEYAYGIQAGLMRLLPFAGCRQVFEVDLGVSEAGRVCGISGNPIRLGWNIEGNAWQNCFLVPFLPPRSPQWTVFHHELGHNFTWSSFLFGHLVGVGVYSEALASTLSLTDVDRILDHPSEFPIGEPATESLAWLLARDTGNFRQSFETWLAEDADFSRLDPDIVDGLFLHHAGDDLYGFASRFFAPLEPIRIEQLGPIMCGVESDDDRHTVFAALVSAAAREDLSDTFRDIYNYPLDAQLFDEAFSAMTSIVQGAPAGRVPADPVLPGRPLTVAREAGGDLALHWSLSCRPDDTDYAVYEGTLGDFDSHFPVHCSTGGATALSLSPAPGNTYYLVAPHNGGWEGSLGSDSAGDERPQGAAPCLPRQVAECPRDP